MRRVGGQPCRPQLSQRSRLDRSHRFVGNPTSGDQGWDYGDGGRNEIARREYLKVALDLRVHSRAIENRITRAIHLHLGHQRVKVRMEVERFAEGMDRHHDGWNAIALTVANAVRVAERIT